MNKQINYIKSTLFDSTLAHFKVNIEARIIRKRQTDQSPESLCYIDNKGNAVLNPNIYLVFGYRGDTREEDKMLYMSYPQLFKIRKALNEMKDLLISDDTFSNTEGVLEVKPQYKDAIVVTDIGKDKKWIGFNLSVVTEDETTGARQRGVMIQISGVNDFVSLLSFDEFLTVYTIVNDLDLSSLQSMYSIFALMNNDSGNAYIPQPQMYGAPQPQMYGGYQQQAPSYGYPQQTPRQQTRPATPRYGTNPASTSAAPATPQRQSRSSATPYTPSQPQAAAPATPQPTRNAAPILSMQNIDETPVETVNWDNGDSLDDIFNN